MVDEPPVPPAAPADTPVRDAASADARAREFAARITAGYQGAGPTIDLGCAVLDGVVVPQAEVKLPLAMGTRHGLVAGATGTGKTVTLQVLAEQFSAAGVPVFLADVKGDLSGLSAAAGTGDSRISERVAEMKVEWAPAGSAVSFLSLGGRGSGVPIRAAISSFGPQLLAKVLGANETQRSSLSLVFHWADSQGLALLDLADLRAVLAWLTSEEGKPDLKGIGGLSPQTAGVLFRSITELETQGATVFFGAPELDIAHLLRKTPDGRGVISCLELPAVQDRPRVFSTFLMWLLAELFSELPEVGDLDRPKLVFFFDEAHLLFADASRELIDQIAQTVRLIRSKGVGVFFVSQLPTDVPDEILAQLGNRLQHGLRSFTPKDAKALKATVSTWPRTEDYDLEAAFGQLGIGEAMVTLLAEDGTPTPVAWTRIRPPVSQIGALDAARVDELAKADPLMATYGTAVDPVSARERLAARLAPPTSAAPRGADPRPAPKPRPERKPKPKANAAEDNPVVDYLRSREGRSMVNTVVRGVLGVLRQRR